MRVTFGKCKDLFRNFHGENQETNEKHSQNDPHLDVSTSFTLSPRNSDPEEASYTFYFGFVATVVDSSSRLFSSFSFWLRAIASYLLLYILPFPRFLG